MPQPWPQTVEIAVASATATTLVLELLIKPRIERRNLRIRVARESRARVSEQMLIILSASVRLRESASLDAAAHDLVRKERERWYGQIEEATRYLFDNIHTYLLTYVGVGGLRDLLNRYVNDAYGVVLSKRSMARKGELLAELTDPAWSLFFGSRVWSAGHVVGHRKRLEAALDRVENPGDGE